MAKIWKVIRRHLCVEIIGKLVVVNYNSSYLTSISCPCLYIVFIVIVLDIIQTCSQIYSLFIRCHWMTPFISCSCLSSRARGTPAFAGLLLLTLCRQGRNTEGEFFFNSSLLLNSLTQCRKQFMPSVKLKWISFLLLFKFQDTDKEFRASRLALWQAMASSSVNIEKVATRSSKILESLGHSHFQVVVCQGLPLFSKRKGDRSSVNSPSAGFDCGWFRNHLILGRFSTG